MKRQERENWLSHGHTTTSTKNNNYNHNTSKDNKTPHRSDTTTSSSSNSHSTISNCSSINISSATTTITTTATTTTIITSNSASSTTSPTNPAPGNKYYRGGHCFHHHLQHQYQHKTRRRLREPEQEPHFRLQSHQPPTQQPHQPPTQQPQFCCDHSIHYQHCCHHSDHQHFELQQVHCCCCDRSRSNDWGGATTPTSPHPRPLDDNDVSVVCLLKCNNKRDITSTNHNWDVCDIASPIIIKNNNNNYYSNPRIYNNNNNNNNSNNNNKIYNSTDDNNNNNRNNNNNNNIYNKCHRYHFPLDVNSKETLLDSSDSVGHIPSGSGCTHNKSGNLGSHPSGGPNTSRNTKRSFATDKLTNGQVKTKQDFCKRGPSFNQVPNADQHRNFTHEMLRRYMPSQTRWLKYTLLIIFLYLMIFAPIVLAYPRPNVIEKANKTVVLFYTAPCRPVSNHQLRRQLGEAYDEERMADSEENVKRSIQMSSTMSPTEEEQSNDAEIDEYFNDDVQHDAPGLPVNDLEDEEEEEEEEEEEDEENDSKGFDEDDEDESADNDDDDEVDDDDDDDDEKDVVEENDDDVSLHGERQTLTDEKDGSVAPVGKKESHLVGARRSRNSVDQKNGRQTRNQVGSKRRGLVGAKQKVKAVGRRGSDLARISSRGKRDLSSASSRNQTKRTNYKVMLSVKYRGQPSLNRKRIARAADLSNNWHCEMKTQWKKMQAGYFPSYLQTGRCVSKSCFFDMYKCIPQKYTIRVLKRDPNRCNPIPTYGLNTTYEERWIFERYHVTVCCQCGSSKRKMSRRRKKKRPRHR